MASPTFKQFAGIRPAVHPTLLGDSDATVAHNCRVTTGKIDPLFEPSIVSGMRLFGRWGLTSIKDAVTIRTLKASNGTTVMLAFPSVVDVAEGNLATDTFRRVFVAGEGHEPEILTINASATYVSSVSLAIPVPAVPVVTRISTAAGDRYTAYAQSFVTSLGYEGGLSDLGDEIRYNNGDAVTVSAYSGMLPSDIVARRIYKVVSGTDSESIQFIQEIPLYVATTITVADEDAGESEPGFESAPSDLYIICKVPGGFYAGVSAAAPRTLLFSDAATPTSWPLTTRYDVFGDIVAVVATAQTVFVLTDTKPFAATGTDPATMIPQGLDPDAACVSRRGVCVLNNAVYYASHHGIMVLSDGSALGSTASNATKGIWTPDQFKALVPATSYAVVHRDAMYWWFPDAPEGTPKNYVIEPTASGGVLVTTHDETCVAACADAPSGNLYFVREGE